MPTFMVFRDGAPVGAILGVAPQEAPRSPTSNRSSSSSRRLAQLRVEQPAGGRREPAGRREQERPQPRLGLRPRDRDLRARRDVHGAGAASPLPGGVGEGQRAVAGSPTSNGGTGLKPASGRRPSPPRAARSRARPGSAAGCSAPLRDGVAERLAGRGDQPQRLVAQRLRVEAGRARRRDRRAPAAPGRRRRAAAPRGPRGRTRGAARSAPRDGRSWNAAARPGRRSSSPGAAAVSDASRASDAGVLVHRRAGAADLGEDRLRAREQLLPGGVTSTPALVASAANSGPARAPAGAPAGRARAGLDVELLGRAREVAVARDRRKVSAAAGPACRGRPPARPRRSPASSASCSRKPAASSTSRSRRRAPPTAHSGFGSQAATAADSGSG